MSVNESNAAVGDRVGERYRIEAEVGHGGMARVYRVLDEGTGQRLALKKLLVAGEQRATLQTMFEREYHSLVQLAHPRIVRAFDYGLDGDDPYYTMELLEGADLRSVSRVAPLSVREICVVLRDAASGLALIHSRRLVHRDLSSRNLWRTPDGRGKLIDFGTLAAMGSHMRAAGTAPFVPPEAVYAQPLDARSDLYGLGALAYFLLAKRNAYPAREIEELRQHWAKHPPRPDAVDPEMPRALSDLVMALLSLDPRGRPAAAAEVIERLTAIADLAQEDESPMAQAFLASPMLVGRANASEAMRKRLARSRRGRSSAVAIVAPAGLGRSRMLTSAVLEAKLMGAAVVSLDASASGTGPFALATAMAERLLEVSPLAAAAASESAAALGYASPALQRALGSPALPEIGAAERARKLTAAFVALVSAASDARHLMIAIDDVHHADSHSLGVLARVGALDGQRLMLLTTCDEAALSAEAPLLELLATPKDRVELAPLAAGDTRALLGSLFGEVPGLDEAASWLHELSQGSPQNCMEYAQYLVDHGLAHYEGGQWRLPERLRDQALPPTLSAMLESRLSSWSEDARSLALGLALARDESRAAWQPENHVAIEDYPRLLGDEESVRPSDTRPPAGAARVFAAIDELVRAGMLQQRDGAYVLGQRAMVDALLRLTDEQALRRMHRRLARVFAGSGYRQGVGRIRHLQRAGEHESARQALLWFTSKLGGDAAMDWGAMRMSLSAECTQVALEHFSIHGGSPREGVILRRMCMLLCPVYDWKLARFAGPQLAQLRSDLGLADWDSTDPALPDAERARECMRRAQQAYDAQPEAQRGLPPDEARRELALSVISSYGAFVNRHDPDGLLPLPQMLAPLRALSPTIALAESLSALGIDRVVGRAVGDRMLAVAQSALACTELPDVTRFGCTAMMIYGQAIADVRCGRARALALVDLLVPSVGEEMFLVVHVRWLCHAFRGRSDHAAQYRRQAEVMAEDDAWRRKASLFIEAELFALTGDLAGLKRTSEAIAALAADFPGWRPWLSWTRGAMHRLRGEFEDAQRELEQTLALASANEHRAWVRAAPAHAELLLLRDDAAAGLREASAILEAVEAHGLDPTAAVAAERVRALCQSRLGDHAAACASIERALARARALEYGGLPLALLHEAHARILLAAGAARESATALAAMHELIEHADAPALIHAYDALRADKSRSPTLDLSSSISPTRNVATEASQLWTEVQVRLSTIDEHEARARQALAMLLEDSGAPSGHLFLFDQDGLFAAASSGADSTESLLPLAHKHLDRELSKASDDVTTALASFMPLTRPFGVAPEPELLPVLLYDDSDGRAIVSGLALIAAARPHDRLPRVDLVRAITRCLALTGDSAALPIDP